MSDPREPNCRAYALSGGKVTGVALTHVPMPDTRYELIKASLVDEVQAQGNTNTLVFAQDKNGIQASVHCWLAWPYKGQWPPNWEGRGLPGNPNYPYDHVTATPYQTATQPGPLCIYLGDANGNIQSDVIAGLGLPDGRHVSYQLVFRERGGGTPVEEGRKEEGGQSAATGGDVTARLQRIEEKLDRIAERFGITG